MLFLYVAIWFCLCFFFRFDFLGFIFPVVMNWVMMYFLFGMRLVRDKVQWVELRVFEKDLSLWAIESSAVFV